MRFPFKALEDGLKCGTCGFVYKSQPTFVSHLCNQGTKCGPDSQIKKNLIKSVHTKCVLSANQRLNAVVAELKGWTSLWQQAETDFCQMVEEKGGFVRMPREEIGEKFAGGFMRRGTRPRACGGRRMVDGLSLTAVAAKSSRPSASIARGARRAETGRVR